MTEAIEMSHATDGTRYLSVNNSNVNGDITIRVEGMSITGPWWRRFRVALAVLFRPRTIRSVNIAVMSNFIQGKLNVIEVGEPNGPPRGNLVKSEA